MTSIDLRHYLDEDGQVPPDRAPVAERFGRIARHASMHTSGTTVRVPVRCRKRPRRRACPGFLVVYRQDAPPCVRWACPVCGDSGTVTGWEGTAWDLQSLVGAADEHGDRVLLPLSLHTVLADFADMSPDCMAIAYSAIVEDDVVELRVPASLAPRCAALALEAAVLSGGGVAEERLVTLATVLSVDRSAESLFADLSTAGPEVVEQLLSGLDLLDAPVHDERPRRRPRRSPRTAGPRTYRIKVSLSGVEPPVWRRLLVPAGLELQDLHDVLQVAMGWQDCHLHAFRAGDRVLSPRIPGLEAIGDDSSGVPLSDLLSRAGDGMVYEYDFGDSWEHRIELETILDESCTTLRCLDGARACPPEDCGGSWGYENLLEAIDDPQHEDHHDLVAWVGGGFDAEAFDAAARDHQLGQMRIDDPP